MKQYLLNLCVCISLLTSIPKSNAQGIMTTVAGNGIAGYTGDGGMATDAELNNPSGVWIDASTNVYIADPYSFVIRKITASSGIISTVAGTGMVGYAGDGGPATNAELGEAFAVFVDAVGNIYIPDAGNSVIRKVSASTGIITTVAGTGVGGYSGDNGPATNAMLDIPHDVCVDNAGNIYIADNGNAKIRKVNASTGIITTIAGHGFGYSGDGGPATAAGLWHPLGVCLDAADNIYIADYGNFIMRKIDASTGIISTVAGNRIDGYSGDGGPATDAEMEQVTGVCTDNTGNFYIADESCQIRKVDATTGIINTVAGTADTGYNGDGGLATAEELGNPSAVCVDASGNIIIADGSNHRVRKATQSITSVNNIISAQLNIFPNPSKGMITVQVNEAQKNSKFDIYNVVGEMVYRAMINNSKQTFDVSKLPSGSYIVQVTGSDGERLVQKIVIEK